MISEVISVAENALRVAVSLADHKASVDAS